MEFTKRVEVISGLALIALIGAGCLLVLAPFVTAILWAAIICFATWPLYARIERLCRHRRTLAAFVMTTLVVVVMVLPFLLAIYAMEESISNLVSRTQDIIAHGLPPPPVWLHRIPMGGDYLQRYWAELAADSEKGHVFLRDLLGQSRGWLLAFFRNFGIGVTHLCISVLIAFFFYRDGDRLVVRLGDAGRRVFGDYAPHLIQVVGNTVRGVVYGILGTALVQGVVAAIGFGIAGIPWAPMLGLLTFFLSLMPFGPPLLWIPITIWLFFKGDVGWGVFMGVWGAAVISGVDNVVRPYLISRESDLSFALVFLGVLGGLLAFGFIGLFLGPTLLAVGRCLLQEFLRHKAAAEILDGKPSAPLH
jgi:predicted PurR-regulated permease PerM